MHESHPVFSAPPDPSVRIWRYMSLAKFVSLLDKRALYFARADRLGDPFEGSVPRANVRVRADQVRALELPPEVAEQLIGSKSKLAAQFPRFVAVNCWHMNPFESAAMWSIYGSAGESIAIQSTYSRLVAAVRGAPETVYVGTVRYLDYDNDPVDEGNLFAPFVCKRKSYEHDRELRAVVVRTPKTQGDETYDPETFWKKETITGGIEVPVTLNDLIERVYINPASSEWFGDVVRSVAGRYGLSPDQVVRSSLLADPFF